MSIAPPSTVSVYSSSEPVITVLREAAGQALPGLEDARLPVADAVALIVAAPDVLHALTNPSVRKGEKFIVLGANAVRAFSVANQFVHIPHVDAPLELVAALFKHGEQVYITGAKQTARTP